MSRKSLLVDGCIPANTECPFSNECGFKKEGICKHLGAAHTVPFSCAAARFLNFVTKKEVSDNA